MRPHNDQRQAPKPMNETLRWALALLLMSAGSASAFAGGSGCEPPDDYDYGMGGASSRQCPLVPIEVHVTSAVAPEYAEVLFCDSEDPEAACISAYPIGSDGKPSTTPALQPDGARVWRAEARSIGQMCAGDAWQPFLLEVTASNCTTYRQQLTSVGNASVFLECNAPGQ